MKVVLCLSGQIGSGKSSVGARLAEILGWKFVGFGSYLRAQIAARGEDPEDRQALQDLGRQRVEEDPKRFCSDVLASVGFSAGENLIVDGVRHVGIFETISDLVSPSNARLIFLDLDANTRSTRVSGRSDAKDFARASAHQVEVEMQDALPKRADALIDANQTIEAVVDDCISQLRKWLN